MVCSFRHFMSRVSFSVISFIPISWPVEESAEHWSNWRTLKTIAAYFLYLSSKKCKAVLDDTTIQNRVLLVQYQYAVLSLSNSYKHIQYYIQIPYIWLTHLLQSCRTYSAPIIPKCYWNLKRNSLMLPTEHSRGQTQLSWSIWSDKEENLCAKSSLMPHEFSVWFESKTCKFFKN